MAERAENTAASPQQEDAPSDGGVAAVVEKAEDAAVSPPTVHAPSGGEVATTEETTEDAALCPPTENTPSGGDVATTVEKAEDAAVFVFPPREDIPSDGDAVAVVEGTDEAIAVDEAAGPLREEPAPSNEEVAALPEQAEEAAVALPMTEDAAELGTEVAHASGEEGNSMSSVPITRARLENAIDDALLAELREAFVMFKYPGDEGDFLDSSRLLDVLRSLGIGLAPTEYAELLAASDPFGRGQIPWKVFLAFAIHLAAGRKSPHTEAEELLEAFGQADSEGVGIVSYRELQRVARRADQEEEDQRSLLQAARPKESVPLAVPDSFGEMFSTVNPMERQTTLWSKSRVREDDSMNYKAFVRRYVTERKWPPNYWGPGGVLATA